MNQSSEFSEIRILLPLGFGVRRNDESATNRQLQQTL